MRSKTIITAGLLTLIAAAPAVASNVEKQETVAKAGDRSPITVLGTGLKKGEKLRRGETLIARDVTLGEGQERRLSLTCKKDSRLRGAAPKPGPVGFAVTDRKSYVGKRRVHLKSYLVDGAETSTGTIYALCRTR